MNMCRMIPRKNRKQIKDGSGIDLFGEAERRKMNIKAFLSAVVVSFLCFMEACTASQEAVSFRAENFIG